MRRKIHDLALLGLAVLAATLAGCATAPPPIQLMDQAQSQIRAARNAGAAMAAPEALSEAERRLAAAQQFSANSDYGKATDKAEEAEAAAATARARAEAARLQDQIQQQSSVNASLQADLKRRQAAAAAAQQAAIAPPAPAASTAGPAAAASTGLGPVMLPSIQLGQPATPAPASSAATPASNTSAGQPGSGGNP